MCIYEGDFRVEWERNNGDARENMKVKIRRAETAYLKTRRVLSERYKNEDNDSYKYSWGVL